VAGSGGTVPWVVVLAGAPSAVVFTTDPDGAPAWMPRAAVEPLAWDRDRQLARIAALVATTRGAVACDVLATPLADALGERTLLDAAPILAEAVAPRSEREVAAISRALAAARAGLRAAAAAVVPGATPAALCARFGEAMCEAAAGFPLHEGMVRRGGVRLEAREPLRTGDVLGLEFGLYLSGHAGVAADTVACGGDLSGLRRAWFETLCALAKRCRAGASAADLRATAVGAGVGQEGLLAHGLGVGIEPPLIDLANDNEPDLRPGTVLVLAPVKDGFRATRTLLVTEGAARWLEPAP
jgi:Xaa-Pro aminopeptidase